MISSINWTLVAPIAGALLGAGGLVALLQVRALNTKTRAEAQHLNTDSESISSSSVQARYDKLFDDMQSEMNRMRTAHQQCENDLQDVLSSLGKLRIELAASTVQVLSNTTEIERLRDERTTLAKSTIEKMLKQLGDAG